MVIRSDLEKYFRNTGYKMIMASDTEPKLASTGGVAVALDPIADATQATYITRGRDKASPKESVKGNYKIHRLFFDDKTIKGYYDGFSNQTLWPLCHVVFQEPAWNSTHEWFEQYKKVNQQYAKAIKSQLSRRRKNFVWINDYQLALVPAYLGRPKNTTVAMFWHIPWPTWETFRVLPNKLEVMRSLLSCNFLGFHRGYHVSNFRRTIGREMEARIDIENQKIFFNNDVTKINNLPLGIDYSVIKELADKKQTLELKDYFDKYQVILSVDRLDYTKGIRRRLLAIDRLLEIYPRLAGKIVHLNLLAPSRENVPAYQKFRLEVVELAEKINQKHRRGNWQPIHLFFKSYPREEIMGYYSRAQVCLVTPLDDGMNLVSKEFVVASVLSADPGMLVLSQFAGSAIDLTSALIVNPYDIDQVAKAIIEALRMPKNEKVDRIKKMAATLRENNIYRWGTEFIRQALEA